MTGTVTKALLTRADMALYDGVNTTYSRTASTGGTVTALRIGDTVDALQVYGGGTARTGGTIMTAVRALGTSRASISLAPGEWTITSSVSVPANLELDLQQGAYLTVSGGATVTLAGNSQLRARRFGVRSDGITNDDTAMASAIAVAQASGADLIVEGTTVLTTGITWNLAKGSLLGEGHCVLDFSAMTSGDALTINVTGTTRGTYQPWRHRVSGFSIKGPTDESTTVDGIVLDGTAGYYALVENCHIYGFRDQVYMDAQAYLNTFRHVSLSTGVRYGLNVVCSTNAGEMIVLDNCAFDGPANSSDNAVAVYIAAGSDAQVYARNTSFDFCDKAVYMLDGMFTASQCHFEQGTDNPLVTTASSGSGNPCHVSFSQCLIRGSDAGSKPESTNGRPAMVEAITDSDYVYVGFQDCQIHRNNDYDTEIVKNTAGGKIRVSFEGTNEIRGLQADLGPIICTETNLINNGGFETGTTSSWTVNASAGFTWTVDGTVAYTGTYSLKAAVVTGTTNAGSTAQSVPVTAGRSLYVRWYGKCTLVAGIQSVRAVFYDRNGNQIQPATILTYGTITSTTDWALRSSLQYVPRGAAYADIQCYVAVDGTAEGTFYWDNVQAWIL